MKAPAASLAVALTLALAAGCSSEEGRMPGLPVPSTTTSAATSTITPPDTTPTTASVTPTTQLGTVGPEGGDVEGGGGVVFDVPPGAFTSETTISVTPSPPITGLPDLLTPIGAAVTITASQQPIMPVVIEMPIPTGAPTEDLYLLRRSEDGDLQIIGGSVEHDRYVAAVPGFSDYLLAGYALERAFALGTERAIDLTPTGLVQAASVDGSESGLPTQERLNLATGDIDRPVARAVRVVGPSELGIGETGSYSALDFVTVNSRFMEYTWTVYGAGAVVSGDAAGPRILVEGRNEGRVVVTVEATDPVAGVSAFGSRRVFVGPTEMGVTILPDQSVYYARGSPPLVRVYVTGGTAPYTYTWSWSTGASDSATDQGGRFEVPSAAIEPEDEGRPQFSSDIVLTVTVTDAEGRESTQSVGLKVLDGWRGSSTARLIGPMRGTVGEPLEYRLLVHDPFDEYPGFLYEVLPGGTLTADGTRVVVTFAEPGFGRVIATLDYPIHESLDREILTLAPVLIEGDAAPLEARIGALPATVEPGKPVAIVVEATGAMIGPASPNTPYVATITFGDGESIVTPIAATTTTAWAGVTVEHAYAVPGPYSIDVTVVAEDGQQAVAAASIDIAADSLPWAYAGIARRSITRTLLFGSGATATIDVRADLEVTLREDGTAEMVMLFEPRTITVNCVDGTAYPSDLPSVDPLVVGGTHADGAFSLLDGRITGSYTSDAIQGRWDTDSTGDACPQGLTQTTSEMAFDLPRSGGG